MLVKQYLVSFLSKFITYTQHELIVRAILSVSITFPSVRSEFTFSVCGPL